MSTPTRRRLRRGLLALLVLVALGLLAGGWYFADQLTTAPPTRPFVADNEVLAAGAGELVLRAEGYAAQDARWGLRLPDDRHVVLGSDPVVTDDGVRFAWDDLTGGDAPMTGEEVRVDEYVWTGTPRAVDLPFEDVVVDGPLGPLPAWWVPAEGEARGTVVFVHGWSATREEALRFLPTIRASGWNSLVASYRGDPGAPAWPDGRVRFGTTEWPDVDAAVAAARERGGPIVLFGSSMGGALVGQFLDRGTTDDVSAVVLDSPVLSLDALLDLQAGRNGVPSWAEPVLLPVVELFAERLHGMDTSALEQVGADGTFDLPVLLYHGTADTFVPAEPSSRLAELEDEVTYVQVPGADHVRSWNLATDEYEAALRAFLEHVA